ncbi:MAG: putative nucleotidyltransferase substrate binding domain-containing protein, partial [Burkholderiales bacterium]
PGLNRLGGFALNDAPGAPGTIDLKLQGARIFVDAGRIYALALGLPQTNTADRLRAARASLGMNDADAAAAIDAFYLIQRLRLQNQIAQRDIAPETANRTTPERLNRISQAALKEALRIAKDLQSRLALDYQL